jgi:hypothetical protein
MMIWKPNIAPLLGVNRLESTYGLLRLDDQHSPRISSYAGPVSERTVVMWIEGEQLA